MMPTPAQEPFLQPTERVQAQKWLIQEHLQTRFASRQLHTTVPIEDSSSLSYEEFVSKYMASNVPVLIKGVCQDWPASAEWAVRDAPNLDALQKLFGDAVINATDTSSGAAYGAECTPMTVLQYIDWWRGLQGAPGSLYAKDWHLAAQFPDYNAYCCPEYFSDDWLNSWYDAHCQQPCATAATSTADYRFVYMGPKGTRSPLHADVLRSYSWSANVAGVKRWYLIPPWATPLLYDKHGNTIANSLDVPAAGQIETWPGLSAARCAAIEVWQDAGDALFVPSCWHHCVENVADVISINHNWLNRYTLPWVLAYMRAEVLEATAAIHDCRELCDSEEFRALVHRNVAVNSGISLQQLRDLLRFVKQRDSTSGSDAVVPWRRHDELHANVSAADAALQELEQLMYDN